VWVTATRNNGFYAQEVPGGQYSGVWVYTGDGPNIDELVIGDVVDISGIAIEFNDELTEVDASMGTVDEVGIIDPAAPDVVALADLAADVGEPWEGVFVRVEGEPLDVTDEPGFDEFIVSIDPDSAFIDNYVYNIYTDGEMDFPDFGVGASFTAIQGPLNFTFGEFKVAPRMAADFEGYIAPEDPVMGIDDLIVGDLVITEIMYDPAVCSDSFCEWVEVYNASGFQVDLNGLSLQDNNFSQTGTIDVSLVVDPDTYVWLGRGPADSWTYSNMADAYYGPNPAYNNSSDRVVILNNNEILDQTHDYSDEAGAGISLQLNPDSIDVDENDLEASWCYSTVDFGDGDLGSPGAVNEDCIPDP